MKYAASQGKHFEVVVTEGRPATTGSKVAEQLIRSGIPCTLVLDSAIAYKMLDIDLVLVGADGVVESGGIINQIGTYQIALVAHALETPFYVAAESYKFARLFPLTQSGRWSWIIYTIDLSLSLSLPLSLSLSLSLCLSLSLYIYTGALWLSLSLSLCLSLSLLFFFFLSPSTLSISFSPLLSSLHVTYHPLTSP